MDKKIRKYKINRIVLAILGVFFTFLGIANVVCLIIGLVLIVLAYILNKKYKDAKKAQEIKEVEQVVEETQKMKEYEYFRFKVVGVTFKDGRKTRQATLRALKWGDEEMETVTLEPYLYEGKDAVYVKINDKIVGNIPADRVDEFMDLQRKYPYKITLCDVYGGQKLDDGTRATYGCEIIARFSLL